MGKIRVINPSIVKRVVKYLGCDTARICQPLGRYFLIIGYNRNTKDDPGQWVKNGEPFDFDYVAEKVIANGTTLEELWESVKFYHRLERYGWKAYGDWRKTAKKLASPGVV